MFYNNQQHQSSSYYYTPADHQQSFGYNTGTYGYGCRANNEFYDNNCYWNNNNNNNGSYNYYESKVERPPSSTTSSSSCSSISLSSLAPTTSFAQENSKLDQPAKKATTKRAKSDKTGAKSKKLKIETTATSSHDSSLVSPICSTDDDLIFETLYNAYITGSLSKSRYKRLIANERERKRMHGLNTAFENLRSVLPSLGSNKQFSKYETLQMAKSYIAALREILVKDSEASSNQHSDYSTYSNSIIKLENNYF